MKTQYMLVMLGVLTVSTLSFVYAQDSNSGTSTPPRQESRTEVRKGRIGEACERVTSRINDRVARYNTQNGNVDAQLSQIETRLKEISAKLKANGANTATLDAQIETLIGKKNQVRADKAAFVAKLSESKQFACAASQGQFRATLEAARELHKKVIAGRQDVKRYAQETIRPTLESLKSYRTPSNN